MTRFLLATVLLTAFASASHAQSALTVDQRVADLNQLASFYSKNYAPYEWKRDVFRFDLLNLFPWQFEIHKPKTDDLDFQELLISYVASLNDAHDYIAFPTTFSASLPFSVDIYDGKVLIDSINRTSLPAAQFPFGIGDELVSLDGQSVQKLIKAFRKYAIAANARSTDRTASNRIVSRSQQIMPHIHELGETATVVIRTTVTGADNTYVIPWTKTGIPVTSQGPVPSPGFRRPNLFSQRFEGAIPASASGETLSIFQIAAAKPTVDSELPSYMQPILPLLNANVSTDYYSILGFGSKFPVWGPPPGFVIRKGPLATDFILSGTFVSNGVRIGFIRIPTMAPPNVATALQQIDQEIAFFNTDTDGLIVDVMRNPGGTISFVESVAQRFMPTPFQTVGFEIRATAAWLFSFAAQLTSAELGGAPPQIVANLRANYEEVQRAYNQFRGRSAPVSLNSTGSLTLSPATVTYSKPLMVLVDEFSASGADMFPAIIQDNHRGSLFGMRTMGAGGSVVGFNATAYTESFFRVTVSLMNRGKLVQAPNFPLTPYIENVGVRPDKVEDYMTRENLVGQGAPFVQAFTAAMENLVRTGSIE
jgi:hypothetical protein